MPDVPIEGSGERGYPSDMEARLRVLEEIAAATKEALIEFRADQRTMRAEMTAGFGSIHSDMTGGITSLRAEMIAGDTAIRGETTAGFTSMRAEMIAMEQRRERDFRILFGAIIASTLGLAYLIAHTAHWL